MGIGTWEDGVDIFWEAGGFFVMPAAILLRVRIFYYGCRHFIKRTDNSLLDSKFKLVK